ncbi:ABC transporter substrate-binding protein [Brachybacterium hainanense]|uniref:ABC transporter substrate-binding protein n=1 Tax=Brachybacterium hainanense TaxID=1541174 RepID=A0ABV6R6W1_9MICO
MTTRRTALSLLAAAGALPVLAACGPNAGNGSSPGGGGDAAGLRVYWWGGDLRNTMTREALDLFTKAHPDVTVAPEYSEWSGYWDKLATQTAGSTMPDVLQMDEAYIDSYGTRDTLLDLESISDQLDLSGMDENMLETGRLADGTLVGAPLGIGIFSVGANLDILEKAGVALPDDKTWTWDDLAETAKQVTDWAGSAGEDVVGFDGFGRGGAELIYWARQSGEAVFPREDEKPLTEGTVVAILDYAKKLIDTGAVPDASTQVEDAGLGVEQSRFGTGRSAFHLQFHTQVQTFMASSGAKMTLLRLPALESGKPQMANKASMYWSIAASTADAKGAGTLVDFLLRDPEAAKVLKIERGVTAFPDLQKELESVLDENEMVALDFARDMQAEVTKPPMVTPASGVGFAAEYTRLAEEALFGNSEPAAAAKEILSTLAGMQPTA